MYIRICILIAQCIQWVGEMLTMAYKGGRGGLDPPFLADIICEQPLRDQVFVIKKKQGVQAIAWKTFLLLKYLEL